MKNHEEIIQLKLRAGLKPYQDRLKDLTQVRDEYHALCPWHEQTGNHSPSLVVYKGKDGSWIFNCRTGTNCKDKSGDAIKFIMLMDEVPFTTALGKLSEGSAVSAYKPFEYNPEQAQKNLTLSDLAKNHLTQNGVPLELAQAHGVGAVEHPAIGPSLVFPYDAEDGAIKIRAINPKDKDDKWRQQVDHPTHELLYNIGHVERELRSGFSDNVVYITESERDCLLMESLGYLCVSVTSATSCLNKDGTLKVKDEYLKVLDLAERIFIATDQDDAGNKCAAAFENRFDSYKIFRLKWQYDEKSNDPKDIGEQFTLNPADFWERIEALTTEARNRPPKWRQQFRSIGEMDSQPPKILIEGFMPEGNIGIGALASHGKTHLVLSAIKSFTTLTPFLGRFPVPEIQPVTLLTPEVNDRQLLQRLHMYGIPNDESLFICRTLSMGATLPLDHPDILEAVRRRKGVVIVDTAIRFSQAESENDAKQNSWMESAARALREAGAIGVIMNCHSPKRSHGQMTLENMFRGTGDIGAIFDVAYGLRMDTAKFEQNGAVEVDIACVKPRDFEPPRPFRIGLKYVDSNSRVHSFIEERGNLVILATTQDEIDAQFVEAVTKDPSVSYHMLRSQLHKGHDFITAMAKRLGWERTPKGDWQTVKLESESEDEFEPEPVEVE